MTYSTMAGGDEWDLTLDAEGNIAVLTGPDAIAMDVASACQVFLGECYYNSMLGIPYQTNILGKQFSGAYLAQKLQTEAKKITGVVQAIATVYIDRKTRKVTATIRVTDSEGNQIQVTI